MYLQSRLVDSLLTLGNACTMDEQAFLNHEKRPDFLVLSEPSTVVLIHRRSCHLQILDKDYGGLYSLRFEVRRRCSSKQKLLITSAPKVCTKDYQTYSDDFVSGYKPFIWGLSSWYHLVDVDCKETAAREIS
jgi:hypothetical protein